MADFRKDIHLPTSIKLKSLSEVESNIVKQSRLKSESFHDNIPKLTIYESEIDESIYDEFIQYLIH